MKKIISLLFLFLAFSVLVSAANCPPSIPKTYSGSVLSNGSALLGSFEIRAVMSDDTVGIGDVTNGQYSVDVSPCSGTTGEVVFSINGIQTTQKGNYNGMDDWGKEVNLNLSVSTTPSTSETCGDLAIQLGEECDGANLAGRNANDCEEGFTGTISCGSNCLIDYSSCNPIALFCGDAVCNNGETCSSCAVDCGNCQSSGGGGGGGSSSASSSTTTITPQGIGTIYAVSETQVVDGISKEMNAGDKIKFQVSGGEHTLNLEAITGNFARITIQSSPVTFVLEIGNTKEIDFENDGFYDLKVKLEEIADGKAKIKIQSIHEEVPQPVTANQTGENNETNGAGITGNVVGFAKSKIGIGLIIGIVIVIAGIGIIVLRKKGK